MARASKRIEHERGIVLDEDGFPVAFVRWEKGQKPDFNQRLPDGTTKRHTVIDGAHYEPGAEGWRWVSKIERDRQTQERVDRGHWEKPDTVEHWVDDKGHLRKRQPVFSQYMNRAPEVPPGWTVAKSPPPKSRARKPIYDTADEQWKFARRCVVLADDGTVLNRVLVDPRVDAEQPALPSGQRMIDEPDGADIPRGARYDGRKFIGKS